MGMGEGHGDGLDDMRRKSSKLVPSSFEGIKFGDGEGGNRCWCDSWVSLGASLTPRV